MLTEKETMYPHVINKEMLLAKVSGQSGFGFS